MNEYYRRDKSEGITPPNLLADCTFADHVVRARGKRTKYTSVSLELCRMFGEQSYRLRRPEVDDAGHVVVEHDKLMQVLKDVAVKNERAERLKALRALRLAKKNKEGLVDWRFDFSGVDKKDVVSWAGGKVREFFSRI